MWYQYRDYQGSQRGGDSYFQRVAPAADAAADADGGEEEEPERKSPARKAAPGPGKLGEDGAARSADRPAERKRMSAGAAKQLLHDPTYRKVRRAEGKGGALSRDSAPRRPTCWLRRRGSECTPTPDRGGGDTLPWPRAPPRAVWTAASRAALLGQVRSLGQLYAILKRDLEVRHGAAAQPVESAVHSR